MSKSKSLLVCLVLVLSFASLSSFGIWAKPERRSFSKKNLNDITLQRLKQKAISVIPYVTRNRFNSIVCFFIDMSIVSGKKRFFVYDLSGDSVLKEGLVAHGSCDAGFQADPIFSNKPNSGCSALGRYKIGGGYQGNFGLAYKLHGLDSSNSNSFNRNIVLHSYTCVPDEETASSVPLCNSRGCPMVSPGFLDQLKPIINSSSKPIVLWIYQ